MKFNLIQLFLCRDKHNLLNIIWNVYNFLCLCCKFPYKFFLEQDDDDNNDNEQTEQSCEPEKSKTEHNEAESTSMEADTSTKEAESKPAQSTTSDAPGASSEVTDNAEPVGVYFYFYSKLMFCCLKSLLSWWLHIIINVIKIIVYNSKFCYDIDSVGMASQCEFEIY